MQCCKCNVQQRQRYRTQFTIQIEVDCNTVLGREVAWNRNDRYDRAYWSTIITIDRYDRAYWSTIITIERTIERHLIRCKYMYKSAEIYCFLMSLFDIFLVSIFLLSLLHLTDKRPDSSVCLLCVLVVVSSFKLLNAFLWRTKNSQSSVLLNKLYDHCGTPIVAIKISQWLYQ